MSSGTGIAIGGSEAIETSGFVLSTRKEAVDKFFNELRNENYSSVDSSRLSDQEVKEVLEKSKESFKSELASTDEHFVYHIIFFLIRCAIISTSDKVKYVGSHKYVVEGKTYTVQDVWVFDMIKGLTKQYKRVNGLRAFCCACEDLYLTVAPAMSERFKTKAIGMKGLPVGKEYLGADFLSGTSRLMSDHDRAVSIVAAKNAVDRSAFTGGERKIVSLYDLGRN
uniref:Minor capsid protein n=1 Tax=Grapevine leafroll-associated virus 2 TaxID=64003 RepID=A0A7S6PX54_9CLOS|nr:minor capsid protein [Grapevine leafroll-associated virus 2]